MRLAGRRRMSAVSPSRLPGTPLARQRRTAEVNMPTVRLRYHPVIS